MTPMDVIDSVCKRGNALASDYIDALESHGYVIVHKEPPKHMHAQAKASYRMNISVGKAT